MAPPSPPKSPPPGPSSYSQTPPPEFLCPVSLEMMDLPVVTCTGTTYERTNIQTWWFGENRATDPATGIVVDNVHLVVNVQLCKSIRAWRSKYDGTYTPSLPTPTMRLLMVDTSDEALAFQAAVEQLYSKTLEQRVAGLKFLNENWKMFDSAWLHCLFTSSAHLELLFMVTDGLTAEHRWRAVQALQQLAQMGPHARAVLLRARYVETLMATLRLPDSAVTAQAAVAAALHDLADFKTHRPLLVERGVLSCLLDMLYSHSGTVTSRALGTLTRLMKTRRAAERLCNRTSLLMLINVLDDAGREEEVLLAAIECLTTLTKLERAKVCVLMYIAVGKRSTDMHEHQLLMASLKVAPRLLSLMRHDVKRLASVHSAAGSLLASLVSDMDAAPRLVAAGGLDPFLDLLTDKAAPQSSKRLVRSAVGQLAGSVPASTGGVWGWWTGQVGPSVRVI